MANFLWFVNVFVYEEVKGDYLKFWEVLQYFITKNTYNYVFIKFIKRTYKGQEFFFKFINT